MELGRTRSAVAGLGRAAALREIAERAKPLNFGLLIHGASIEIMYAGATARQAYGLNGRKIKPSTPHRTRGKVRLTIRLGVAVELSRTRSAVARLGCAAALREITERSEPLHFGLLIHGSLH